MSHPRAFESAWQMLVTTIRSPLPARIKSDGSGFLQVPPALAPCRLRDYQPRISEKGGTTVARPEPPSVRPPGRTGKAHTVLEHQQLSLYIIT